VGKTDHIHSNVNPLETVADLSVQVHAIFSCSPEFYRKKPAWRDGYYQRDGGGGEAFSGGGREERKRNDGEGKPLYKLPLLI